MQGQCNVFMHCDHTHKNRTKEEAATDFTVTTCRAMHTAAFPLQGLAGTAMIPEKPTNLLSQGALTG